MRGTVHLDPLLLDRIRAAISAYPPALARVAASIIEDPEFVINSSIDDFAHHVDSGSASIVRFCRRLGYSGFREFKIALNGELEKAKFIGSRGECSTENLYIPKELALLSETLQSAVAASARLIDEQQVIKLAGRLRSAKRIVVLGAGASSVCADILASRLAWTGLPIVCASSPELARTLNKSCVAVGLLWPEATKELWQFLSSASTAGAHSIAITADEACLVAKTANEIITIASDPAIRKPGSCLHISSILLLSEYIYLCLQSQ
ncbi:transcriptional regulator [Rhizobium altiplani]|uniref:Transcriptional regulator n=2 Tax=Rhizobium TaxID=379 RepID=A0A109JP06_9HYPH|nr:transcriptional regulator [Rhizobium altiplani]CCM80373.1 putative transcriptional regulator, HTH RpiR family [Rhizobium mesoamericanum STM3625]